MKRRSFLSFRLDDYKTKLHRLQNLIQQSHENNPKLHMKNKELQDKVTYENMQLFEAGNAKTKVGDILRDLGIVSKKARDELFLLNEKEHALEDRVDKYD